MPAFSNHASTASSGDARAPVCDDAARLPSALRPDLMATMRAPLLYSERACFSSFCGSLMLSRYSIFTGELWPWTYVSSRYSRMSSISVTALLPTENTEANLSPSCIAASSMKTIVAPEPERKSMPILSSFGTGWENIPV